MLVPPERGATASDKVLWFFLSRKNCFFVSIAERRMFSHIHIGVADFPRALAFYGPVLERLGLVVKFTEPGKTIFVYLPLANENPMVAPVESL